MPSTPENDDNSRIKTLPLLPFRRPYLTLSRDLERMQSGFDHLTQISAIAADRIDRPALLLRIERADLLFKLFRSVDKLYFLSMADCYRESYPGRRLPGSTKTKRLMKKRRRKLSDWMDKELALELNNCNLSVKSVNKFEMSQVFTSCTGVSAHQIIVDDPLADRELDERIATEMLERFKREHPEVWEWTHKNHQQLEAESDLDCADCS